MNDNQNPGNPGDPSDEEKRVHVQIDMNRMRIPTWQRYARSPYRWNLIKVLKEVVVDWSFEGDPAEEESYKALTEAQFQFVSHSLGQSIKDWQAEHDAKLEEAKKKRARKKKGQRMKKAKRKKGDEGNEDDSTSE